VLEIIEKISKITDKTCLTMLIHLHRKNKFSKD